MPNLDFSITILIFVIHAIFTYSAVLALFFPYLRRHQLTWSRLTLTMLAGTVFGIGVGLITGYGLIDLSLRLLDPYLNGLGGIAIIMMFVISLAIILGPIFLADTISAIVLASTSLISHALTLIFNHPPRKPWRDQLLKGIFNFRLLARWSNTLPPPRFLQRLIILATAILTLIPFGTIDFFTAIYLIDDQLTFLQGLMILASTWLAGLLISLQLAKLVSTLPTSAAPRANLTRASVGWSYLAVTILAVISTFVLLQPFMVIMLP